MQRSKVHVPEKCSNAPWSSVQP